jgi:2-polyprenyl-6-methoxyphenol hydroxylase-like FAD-dependent oxidoreductase
VEKAEYFLTAVYVAILIVGAGPSGATTALHLGRLGISSLVISRHPGTATTPRAHIFNQRAMEVLRDAGIEGKALKVATSSKDMLHTSWSRSLAGEEYGRLYAWGNDPKRKGDYEMASPCAMTDVPQSVLEPILVEEASQAGAEFRFGIEFLSQETIPDGRIKTTVRDRSSGELYHVLSTYLIGCDGARSAVLDSIGIPVDGKQLNTAFNVHIMADLSKYMTSRPGSLNWILNPDAPGWSAVGNFRMVRPWNEWVVSMHPALRDGDAQFEPSNAEILTRLYQMIGDDTIPITILSSFRYVITTYFLLHGEPSHADLNFP